MRIIPSRSYRRMPWKNGGGETIEIAISPAGASLDTFEWRVSMARVEAPGPFSIFPQIDRTLAILQGAGIRLRLSGEEVRLGPESEPYDFPGDIPVDAILTDGPITDLNVMTRRGSVRHRLRRIPMSGAKALSSEADEMLVLAHEGFVRVESGGASFDVAAGDAAVWDEPGPGTLVVAPVSSAATLYVMEFWRERMR
jgi:environmental stress-induced protein Ves